MLTHNTKMHEVYPQLHDPSVRLVYGDAAVLVSGPEVWESRWGEVREVVLDRAAAGYFDCGREHFIKLITL